ncbi:MAG TPA: hypothetical protein VFX50_00085 [Gemmatimonadales bacterium]|nr:hypothetical protein [Gemmatimonadales bacterium]
MRDSGEESHGVHEVGDPNPMADATNPVVALCAAGMANEGDARQALALFEQAWAARRDDHDAAIAAHFLARHQSTPGEKVRWNRVALEHAEALTDGRASPLLPSLLLNLADSLLAVGRRAEARSVADRASAALAALPVGGYRDFTALGVRRLLTALTPPEGESPPAPP